MNLAKNAGDRPQGRPVLVWVAAVLAVAAVMAAAPEPFDRIAEAPAVPELPAPAPAAALAGTPGDAGPLASAPGLP